MSDQKPNPNTIATVLGNLVSSGYDNTPFTDAVVAIATRTEEGRYATHFMSLDASTKVHYQTNVTQQLAKGIYEDLATHADKSNKDLKDRNIPVKDSTGGNAVTTVGDVAAHFIIDNYDEFNKPATNGALVGSFMPSEDDLVITAGLVVDGVHQTQHGGYHMENGDAFPAMLLQLNNGIMQEARQAAACIVFADAYIGLAQDLAKTSEESK